MIETAAPSEPIPFRVLLDEAMKLTRRHFGRLFLPVAVPLAIVAGLVTVVQVGFLADVYRSASPAMMFSGRGCVVFVGLLLVWMLMRALASVVLTAAAVDGASQRPIDVGTSWRFLLQPSTLGTVILSLLVISIGFVFLVLPGIYLGLGFSLLLPVMAAEGLRGTAAMKRSWTLVRYNPHKRFFQNTATKVFVLYLVAGLIAYALGLLIQLPLTLAMGVRAARTVAGGGTPAAVTANYWLQVPSAILQSLISTAIAIYTSFGIVLLYMDVVRRKEGGELASAIDARFGAAPEAAPTPPGTTPA